MDGQGWGRGERGGRVLEGRAEEETGSNGTEWEWRKGGRRLEGGGEKEVMEGGHGSYGVVFSGKQRRDDLESGVERRA